MYQGEYTMPRAPLRPNQAVVETPGQCGAATPIGTSVLDIKYLSSQVLIAARYLQQSTIYGSLGSDSTYLGGAGSANTSRKRR